MGNSDIRHLIHNEHRRHRGPNPRSGLPYSCFAVGGVVKHTLESHAGQVQGLEVAIQYQFRKRPGNGGSMHDAVAGKAAGG